MHTKRALNHWLRMAWPAFEVSLHAEIQRFSSADAREGLASIRGKRQAVFLPDVRTTLKPARPIDKSG
ncbi:hypothetical protein ACFS07_34390 [Undibacterium arcticum]